MDSVIQTMDLTKKYGEYPALNRLDLTVNKGEVLGYLGPNGAGKSTTMKLLVGLIMADEGIIKIDNKDINTNLEYIKSTKDDLRNHYSKMPFGTLDGFQIVIFMTGHTARHTAQIESIKAEPNFPK